MFRWALRWLGADERGGTAVAIAGSMSALMTFAGLGVEFGMWGVEYRRMQGAADAAAFAGAARRYYNDPDAMVVQDATAIAARHGFATDAATSTTVTVDPQFAENVVRVVIRTVKPTYLLHFAGLDSIPIEVSATAEAQSGQPTPATMPPCLLTLASSGVGIHFQGSVTFDMAGCSFATNSVSSNSINVTGGSATIIAASGHTAGGISDSQGRLPAGITTYGATLTDPYANRELPPLGTAQACTRQGSSAVPVDLSGTITLTGNVEYWCGARLVGNLTINANNHAVIFINTDLATRGFDLTVENGTLVFTDATLHANNTGFMSRRVGTISFGNSRIRLDPPDAGTAVNGEHLVGLAVFQKRRGASSVTVAPIAMGGGSVTAFDGVVYMPDGAFSVQGGGSGGTPCPTGQNVCPWRTTCNNVVALTVSLAGTAGFRNQCDGVPGVIPPPDLPDPLRPRLTG